MKTEDEIKKALENIKEQLPTATGPNEALILQTQYGTLKWVLPDKNDDTEAEE